MGQMLKVGPASLASGRREFVQVPSRKGMMNGMEG